MISSRTQSFETFVQIYNFYKKKKRHEMCDINNLIKSDLQFF